MFLFFFVFLFSRSFGRLTMLLRSASLMNATIFLLSKVEDLFLLFAKKASAFNSWFENAEEDLTDPVRCNSVEEIRVSSLTEQAGISLFFIFPVANLATKNSKRG